jgi:hypothetical protein
MRQIFLLCGLYSCAAGAFAASDPCADKKTLDLWLQCRLQQTISAQQTQQNPTKQTDSPAVSSSATSLVDHTSVADFATAALNVAGFGNGSSQTPAGTTTISAYAIYSAILGQNPLDPAFYNANADWRRVTFSVGTDAPANNSSKTSSGTAGGSGSTSSGSSSSGTSSTATSSASGTSGNGTGSSRVVGASVLIINDRDLAKRQADINNAANVAAGIAIIASRCSQAIKDVLFNAYASRVPNASDDADKKDKLTQLDPSKQRLMFIDYLENDSATSGSVQAILNQYASSFAAESEAIKSIVQKIQNAFQFSISGQATIGDTQMQNSDYRGQVVLEQGAGAHWDFTLNGSFDYINSHLIGADTRGGRAAVDIQYLFASKRSTNPKVGSGGKKPISLDFNGESDWFQSFHPSYVGQAQLNIPLMAGVDLPLSFSYASSANVLHEAHSVAKFGLTFDLSKITAALSKH